MRRLIVTTHFGLVSGLLGAPAGYDEYSLLDLYSGFFWLLVPYSEILLLDRVASRSKKAQIFQNIPFLDTDIKVFWFISFSWSRIFASLLFVSTWQGVVFIFCENANISDRPRPPCWGFHKRYQCLNFKTDLIAKINSPIIMMVGARNENRHQIIGLHTLLEITR